MQLKNPKTPNKAVAIIAAACLVCLPFTARREGLRTRPYLDAGRIATVCYGETNVAMRVYSAGECGAMLRAHMMQDYAPAVARCLPELVNEGKSNALAAFVDAAYNAGIRAACNSRMAMAVHDGNLRAACKGFIGWYVTAKGRRLPGLVQRRIDEARLCLKDVTIQIVPVDFRLCVPVKPGPIKQPKGRIYGLPQPSEVS